MKKGIYAGIVIAILVLGACEKNGSDKAGSDTRKSAEETYEKAEVIEIPETVKTGAEKPETEETETEIPETEKTEPEVTDLSLFRFVDVFGEEYETTIKDDVPKHDYKNECFAREGDVLKYEDEHYSSRLGIDVSRHQGQIDWERVREQGVEFAFLRIGYRGYGEEGKIRLDERFYENLEGAQGAGIDVGVYFFSQAVNEEEALEEAGFVLDALNGCELQLPVVYDPESILDDVARTDDVSGEQFTKNTVVFCDTIKENGYEPMIYSNMLWEAFKFDLGRLTDIPVWYADYEAFPQTPYHFVFWQYTNEGHMEGIEGEMDYDIQLVRKTSGME